MPKDKPQAVEDTVHFKVEIASLYAHLFRVTLTVLKPAPSQRLSLPVWIPGSYLVREFSKTLQNLRARQGRRELAATQIDKCSWNVACDTAKPLIVTYEIYALDMAIDASR